MAKRIKKWFRAGLWSREMVKQAQERGVITAEQAEDILSEDLRD